MGRSGATARGRLVGTLAAEQNACRRLPLLHQQRPAISGAAKDRRAFPAALPDMEPIRMQVNSGAAPDAPSLAPTDLHVARGSVQGDRNSEVPMPIAQAGARRTLPVSPMNRNASTSTMIPTALTTRNAPTAMAAAPSAGR